MWLGVHSLSSGLQGSVFYFVLYKNLMHIEFITICVTSYSTEYNISFPLIHDRVAKITIVKVSPFEVFFCLDKGGGLHPFGQRGNCIQLFLQKSMSE